jgi:hypothetical protein
MVVLLLAVVMAVPEQVILLLVQHCFMPEAAVVAVLAVPHKQRAEVVLAVMGPFMLPI